MERGKAARLTLVSAFCWVVGGGGLYAVTHRAWWGDWPAWTQAEEDARHNAATAPAPRPSYGQPCSPPSPGCFYLGDEYTGVPLVEVFDSTDGGAR